VCWLARCKEEGKIRSKPKARRHAEIFALAGTFLAIRFFEKAGRKMKSIYLILSAALVAMATLWARAAAQGLEPALVSVGAEFFLKGLRATTRAFSNINSLAGENFHQAPET
jgi:hypothetical protein